MRKTYGNLTEAAIGVLIREIVARMMKMVRTERFNFVPTIKGYRDSGKPDWVTDIDPKVQKAMTRLIQEYLPTCGIIGEEDGLSIPAKAPTLHLCTAGDPIDGTRAFVFKHSGGISVMLALASDDKIICVCIGDVMTDEMYYFRPGSKKTHHLDPRSASRLLNKIPRDLSLKEQYVLLRDPAELHNKTTQRLLHHEPDKKLFKSNHTAEGSIGLSMARLWKGEVGAAILQAGKQTPWDSWPVIGITERLGFCFFAINPATSIVHCDSLTQTRLLVSKEVYRTNTDILVIHESHVPELTAWCIQQGFEIKLDTKL